MTMLQLCYGKHCKGFTKWTSQRSRECKFLLAPFRVSLKKLISVFHLNNGTPAIKYLSIEDVKTTDSIGLQAVVEQAFKSSGASLLSDKLVGLNVNGAFVNMGHYKGLATPSREMIHWLEAVHCFNHRQELAFKDALKKVPAFQKIDNFLLWLYYM